MEEIGGEEGEEIKRSDVLLSLPPPLSSPPPCSAIMRVYMCGGRLLVLVGGSLSVIWGKVIFLSAAHARKRERRREFKLL